MGGCLGLFNDLIVFLLFGERHRAGYENCEGSVDHVGGFISDDCVSGSLDTGEASADSLDKLKAIEGVFRVRILK